MREGGVAGVLPNQAVRDPGGLHERERELAAIARHLAEAQADNGRALLIEGVAGIGKTSLLGAIRTLSQQRGFRVLGARAAELERKLAFGVVRQVYEPVLRDPAGPRHDELFAGAAHLALAPLGLGVEPGTGGPAPGSELHGLYWLTVTLCDQGPLLVWVDDLHWSDGPSLRFLAYLAARVAEHPLAIVATSRPQRPRNADPAAAALAWTDVFRPQPLSEDAVQTVVRQRLSPEAEREFCLACARATGGNPFLLAEVIAALRADGIAPTASQAPRIISLGGQALSHALLARLARVGPEAVATARALCILGADTPLRQIAAFTELSPETVSTALDALTREGLFADELGELAHPLMRDAVLADLSSHARGLAHLRAARLLADEGEAVERIAVPHLLAAEPTGDPWVVETLRAAAAAALSSGAPETAVPLLERALSEPPEVPVRALVLTELGRALVRAGRPDDGAEALEEALDLTEDPGARAQLALELGGALFVARRLPDARDLFAAARSEWDQRDAEILPRLASEVAFMDHAVLEPSADWRDDLGDAVARSTGGGPQSRTAQAVLAYLAATTGSDRAPEVARLARDAGRDSPHPDEGFLLMPFANAALCLAGHPGEAVARLDRGIEAAAGAGDKPRFSFLVSFRARTLFDAGRLQEAEADARTAVDSYVGSAGSLCHLLGTLGLLLIDRGEHAEAETVLAANADETEAERGVFPYTILLWMRGRLHAAQGRNRQALDDLHRCGEILGRAGFDCPTNHRWRSDAALCHLALGELEQARRLAADELELARAFGAPMPIGVALRAVALVEGGAPGIELLRESVAVLDGSEARLEHARSLVELGAALRRAGRRTHARKPLRAGLDLATRCGARPLATRAREELVAAGGRPRRDVLSGPEALTASELRVARLAAEGHSNREIAQSLFVTRRTVEAHLTNTYRKLEIESRDALPTVLGRQETAWSS